MCEVDEEDEYEINLQMLGVIAKLDKDGVRIAQQSSVIGACHGNTVQAAQDNSLAIFDGLDNIKRSVHFDQGHTRCRSCVRHRPIHLTFLSNYNYAGLQ